mmetsp:Transcript_42303/g.106742  ORF Transcript_42303/g.106742 Transcript_42303/m.106742 type:complete len:233 (-) Transcript_42303:486-1184(-)|eukprot:CAMPEP_0174248028 /NCGR_PEP_ID=MMETSP0417-20130205/42803_1 /TAXON_ID=242541 /ORGANISM="Mayorella sp, Strain BSH-02190019" /LENGTH=232 /DNA_ID=CAMNT_0015327889 /DNA_START=196 /DNA_END=894 /DNA_ORIENTATION=+
MDGVFRQLIAKRAVVTADASKQRTFVTKAFKSIVIQEDPNGGVGGSIWDANYDLLEFIQDDTRFPAGFFVGKRVLELGSGTGLAGLVCASLGATITLTDRADTVDLLKLNLQLNAVLLQDVQTSVQELEWGKSDCSSFANQVDVVVAAECIYNLLYGDVLLATLQEVCTPGTLVLFSYAQRNPDKEAQWFELVSKDFVIEKISNSSERPREAVDPEKEKEGPVKIVLLFTRK